MDGKLHRMDATPAVKALQISKNRRHLEKSDGEPFLWLGDTAWELIHRLDLEETEFYLQNRKKVGFTLIQTVILAELDGLHTPNASGEIPLHDNDPEQPNEAYFKHVDQVVRLAHEKGLYLGLLPTWGDKFNKKWGVGPEIFTPENARAFGEFLGQRYANFPHIIWIMGGDRVPENPTHKAIIEQMACGIRNYQPETLMSYHPNGGYLASDFFGKSSWLNLDLFQSRHQKGFREYRFTRKARKRNPSRPVIDGEPGYENIPNLLNKWHFQRLTAADVRKAAYWNLLSGAAGHSYGCNEIWQMYDGKTDARFGAQFSWKKALALPGARHMGILRKIFESVPWQQMDPDPSVVRGITWKWNPLRPALSTARKDWILIYIPGGKRLKIKSNIIRHGKKRAFWIDPEQGEKTEINGELGTAFAVPSEQKDWLLLILDESNLPKWRYFVQR